MDRKLEAFIAALLVVFLLALPIRAQMLMGIVGSSSAASVVAFGNHNTTTDDSNTNPITWAFDSGSTGTNRVMLVALNWYHSSTVSTFTYSVAGLTLVDEIYQNLLHTAVYKLVAPATGSNNFVLTKNNAAYISIHAVVFSSVNQTTPTGTVVKDNGTTATSSAVTATLATNGMMFSAIGWLQAPQTHTPGTITATGQTQINYTNDSTSVNFLATYYSSSTGVANKSWTDAASQAAYGHIAVPIQPL